MTNKMKKIISMLLIAVMALSLPFSAQSIPILYAKEDSSCIYNKDGITIDFKIASKWEKGFEGQIIITNQSNAALENWKMEFDFDHKITSIWDGEIESNKGNKYTIKHPSWNMKIPKDGKAVIGFIADSSGQITEPKSCKLLNGKSEIQTEDYTISYRITSDWNDALNAEITILNNTDKAIEGWTLEFDYDKTIKQMWNAKVMAQNGSHYTIRNDEWNSVIKPKEKVSFGFEASLGNAGSEPKNFKITASGGTSSDAAEEEEQDLKTDLIKDTDGDGLEDYIERGEPQTDINNPDTDGDGLSDYYEYIVTQTTPTLKDTDGNGITDEKEDPDKDGLNNLEELKADTQPLLEDTDEDGLMDGEEVLKYKTDPNKMDTDEDLISDYDEIELGLDPNNAYTHDGIKDSEYKIWHDIRSESLKEINRDNDFEVSLRLHAAGNAKNLPVDIDYSPVLHNNRAVIGATINFYYPDFALDKGEISFKLKNNLLEEQRPLLSNQKLGLKRYSIFRFDEKSNLLYPIPVEYDEANQTIQAEFNESGVFCLVDLECLVYDLGLESEKKGKVANKLQNAEPKLKLQELKQMLESDYERKQDTQTKKRNAKKQIDLVLAIDSTGSMDSYINSVKENMVYLLRDLRDAGISLYVSVIDYKDIVYDGENSTKINYPKKVDFLNNTDDIIKVLDTIKIGGGGSDGPETALDALGAAANLDFRKSADKYVFLITSAGYKNDNSYDIKNMDEMIKILKEKGITTSVVSEYKDKEKYNQLCDSNQGKWINLLGQFQEEIYKILIQNKKDSFYGVLASDLSIISLDKEPEKNGKTDTDGDRLPDSKEIVWENITVQEGTMRLPTMETLLKSKIKVDSSKLSNILFMDKILKLKVVPVTSNPTEMDSDGDYYMDKDDKHPFSSNPMGILDDQIEDMDVFEPDQESRINRQTPNVLSQAAEIVDSKIVYDDPNIAKKPSVMYYRATKLEPTDAPYQFTLEPKRNSDYIFTISKFASVKKQSLIMEQEKTFLWKKLDSKIVRPYKKAEKKADGSISYYYSLKQGEKYTITVYCSSGADKRQSYSLKAEQDNWVKVGKHGGVWTNSATKVGLSYPINSYYIDKDTGYYIAYIKYDESARAELESFLIGGGTMLLSKTADVIKKFAEKRGIVILQKAVPFISWASEVITIYSWTSSFFGMMDKIDYKNAMKEGEGIIYSVSNGIRSGTISVWDPWPKKSATFINKYIMGYRGTIRKGFSKKDGDALFK